MKNKLNFEQNAHHNAQGGVRKHNTTKRACFSVRSVVRNACVFLQATMVTKLCALATTTGRQRKEVPNALEPSLAYLSLLINSIVNCNTCI